MNWPSQGIVKEQREESQSASDSNYSNCERVSNETGESEVLRRGNNPDSIARSKLHQTSRCELLIRAHRIAALYVSQTDGCGKVFWINEKQGAKAPCSHTAACRRDWKLQQKG
jgi:hypothetical protein